MQICYIFCWWDSTFKVEMFFRVVFPVCCVQCLSASYNVLKGLSVPHILTNKLDWQIKKLLLLHRAQRSWKGWRCLPKSGNFIKRDFSWCPYLPLMSLLTSMAFVLFTAKLYVMVSKLCHAFQWFFLQNFSDRIFHCRINRQVLELWSEVRAGSQKWSGADLRCDTDNFSAFILIPAK